MTSNQSQHMKCTLTTIIVALLSLAAVMLIPGTCSSPYDARLQHIDSLMDSNPQAAYDSLSLFDSLHLYDGDRAGQMRLQLLMAKAQNKLYRPMPSDSTFMEVVSYYDSHGSANDRMLSRYLQGCIYRDMDNGPKAVRCYLEALELADTTSKDCNYSMLSKIQGQLATVYNANGMYVKALEADSQASIYAKKAGNIYDFIRQKEFVGGDYYALHDTVRAIKTAKECIRLYEKHGMPEYAAGACPTIIYTHIVQGQYDSARLYMNKFERESGLFNGRMIEKGREHYYYAKGLYCLRTQQLDSAKYYFRELLKYDYQYEAYKGLADYYAVLQVSDSSKKYYELAEEELDAAFEKRQTNEIIKELSLYKVEDSSYMKPIYAFILLGVLSVLTLFVLCFRFFGTGKLVSSIRSFSLNSSCNMVVDTGQAPECSTHFPNVTQNKESDVVFGKMDEQKEYKRTFIDSAGNTRAFVTNNIGFVGKLKQKADIGKTMSSNEWKTLKNDVANNLGEIYHIVFEKDILSEQEAKVCILLLLGLKSGHIAVLIGKSSQRVSNAKAIINKKLFGSTDAKTLLRYLHGTK